MAEGENENAGEARAKREAGTAEDNEIVAATRAVLSGREGARKARAAARAKRWRLGSIGIGVGLGSAAVAAAVMFANRGTGD